MTAAGHARVLGLGTALPAGRLSSEAFVRFATAACARAPREANLVRAATRLSNIAGRHSVLVDGDGNGHATIPFYLDREPDAEPIPTTQERMVAYEALAPELAAEAAREALAAAGTKPQEITHLVTVSCTGFAAPGCDLRLIGLLGLSPTVARTNVGFMGCHGAINGMRCAEAFARADAGARVLMVCVELCTLHFQFGTGRDALLPNTLFGDASAAMVIGQDPRLAHGCLYISRTASRVIPNSAGAMSWRMTDTGFRMTLDSSVPDLIAEHVGPWMTEELARRGMSIQDVGAWAIHPGGPRILESALQSLGLEETHGDCSRQVLRDNGNLSSPTVLFILRELLGRGAHRPIVMLAFGPGLVAEMALLE